MITCKSGYVLLFAVILNHVGILTAENDIGCQGDRDVDVVQMCNGGSLTTSSFLLSAYSAKGMNYQRCECVVLVNGGNKLTMSPVSEPGYDGCGSEIQVTRNDQIDESQVIRCKGGTTHTGLTAGNTLSFSLHLTNSPYDSSYCYRLDIEGTAPSMTITCDQAVTIPTTSEDGTFEVSTVKDANKRPKDAEDRCNSPDGNEVWMYPLLAVICLYSVFITVGCCLRIILSSSSIKDDTDDDDIPSRTSSVLSKVKAKRSTLLSRLSSTYKAPQQETITESKLETEAQYCENINSANSGEKPMGTDGASNPSHWNLTYDENEGKSDTGDAVYSCITECK